MENKGPDVEGEPPSRTGHIGNINDKWDNGFYTHGLILDLGMKFLIDSGSTASILSIDMFDKLPFDIWSTLSPNETDILLMLMEITSILLVQYYLR